MADVDLSWLIGGPQGGGINVAAEGFAKAAARAGFSVTANIEYHSNIMGEHSFYRVRVGTIQRRNITERVHVLVALDDETLRGDQRAESAGYRGHVAEVVPGGAVVHDAAIPVTGGRGDIRLCAVPYDDLLAEALKASPREGQANLLRVMRNTVAVGASLALVCLDVERYTATLRQELGPQRTDLADLNAAAARLGYEYVRARYAKGFPFRLPPAREHDRGALLVKGVEAAAVAKLKAGLGLQTYYPISPASDESTYLEAHEHDQKVVVVQTEDEVSAIHMAIGAAHAGVRSATSTSGPGFSLMVEGMGYAAMTEAPGPVVVLWQRGGPSTGLPTRVEQADLGLALHPGHGEFPHIVVAPGDIREVVADVYEAFNWAERYQVPVIVLADKSLASTYTTLDDLGLSALPAIDRGAIAAGGDGDYLRYALGEGGVSPRGIPGRPGTIFWATTDEHNARGHLTEDAHNRIQMEDKRLGKLARIGREIPAERAVQLHGPADADVTVVAWGSTKGPILDALEVLAQEDGVRANLLQIRLLKPFPTEAVTEALRRPRRTVLVELNYLSQLGLLIREQTGMSPDQRVLKYDGRPFTEEELLDGLRSALRGEAGRVAVSHLLG